MLGIDLRALPLEALATWPSLTTNCDSKQTLYKISVLLMHSSTQKIYDLGSLLHHGPAA